MKIDELERIIHRAVSDVIHRAVSDVENLERLKDVFDILIDDIRLIRHSHKTFLPAARDYLLGRSSADYRLKEARVRRARLGGASRWLYHHQKQTFVKVLHLLFPIGIPEHWTDSAWNMIKNAEIRVLSHARRGSKG
jgi:hypothetical protein